jgi:hypothetical protein
VDYRGWVQLVGGSFLDRIVPGRKVRRELRARWGRPGRDEASVLASGYFDLVRDKPGPARVEDRTWNDLEFPRIFTQLDTTLTPIGRQVLFAQLRTWPGIGNEAARVYDLCDYLRTQQALRERIQSQLAALRDDSNAGIAWFAFGPGPTRPKRAFLLPLWGLASLVVLVATIAFGWSFWIWLAILPVNAAILFRTGSRLNRDTRILEDCARTLRVAQALARLARRELPPLQRLVERAPQRVEARRVLRWVTRLQRMDLGIFDLSSVLTLAFLAKPIACVVAIGRFERLRPALATAFEAIGAIDAAIAVASFLECHPDHCRPGFTTRPLLDIRDGCHPLLARPVKNSLRLDGQSALVTGSNMAGKTTFVKMIAINQILGRTVGFCLAASATLPLTEVMTSIRGEQSVESGRSHYFSEVEAIRTFLAAAARGRHPILVIDELFRGTNTCERVALARAVLEYLGQRALVLVTTHDVELQPLLAGQYMPLHFRENPDVEGFFDYRLRAGTSRARNAIRILERVGFPARIVASAMDYASGEPVDER